MLLVIDYDYLLAMTNDDSAVLCLANRFIILDSRFAVGRVSLLLLALCNTCRLLLAQTPGHECLLEFVVVVVEMFDNSMDILIEPACAKIGIATPYLCLKRIEASNSTVGSCIDFCPMAARAVALNELFGILGLCSTCRQ
jgi:hypothetical protein